MRSELFPFQKAAVWDMRNKVAEAIGAYGRTHSPQILSLQAPTGSGKTIMMASLIEEILFGSSWVPPGEKGFAEQPDAIFVWLSDSPELNSQSKDKIDIGSDKITFGTTTVIDDECFDCEKLEDGKIYFLNTQKLSVNANLAKKSDRRQWTIWETLENTARDKADRLYFIIDEAHRGMHGTEAGRATSIMQRFLKGYSSAGCEMRPMPFVIGMSATAARFNRLAEGLPSTTHKTIVSADQVRASGLLKDRIVIGYPEDSERQDDMALLGSAIEEWMDKCAHWEQYCREQHYKFVDPVFVIQVKSGSGSAVSDTDLDDVISKIESRSGMRFKDGEVVHTFGSANELTMNGLKVRYVEPSKITDDKRIKVVLFKENLSTGWDCPRAETMMSFRTANDATYIAQLLGRMIRTPLQNRVRVDESLNEVRLFLPYFDADTVAKVIDELKSSECGDIPVDVEGESVGGVLRVPWSIRPKRRPVYDPNQQTFTFVSSVPPGQAPVEPHPQQRPDSLYPLPPTVSPTEKACAGDDAPHAEQLPLPLAIDREAVVKAINSMALLTYVIRTAQINDYLKSLLDLSGLLTREGIKPEAKSCVEADVIGFIHDYAEKLRADGKYDVLAKRLLEFKLAVKVFDAFGNPVDRYKQTTMAFASESDIDRRLREADMQLARYGFANIYGRKYATGEDTETYKIDFILFVSEQSNMDSLYAYAKDKFHKLNDECRKYIVQRSERCQDEYRNVVMNGDKISEHAFRLGEEIFNYGDKDGKRYTTHLYADEDGIATIRLNSWEEGVIEEEEKRNDFVCWLRNSSRAPWALRIPYEYGNKKNAMYPDFIVVRRDTRMEGGYVFDLLEPHNPALADNLAKAKGLAAYAAKEERFGRIQMIRKYVDLAGQEKFKRLDFCKGEVREKVSLAITDEDLNKIFEMD